MPYDGLALIEEEIREQPFTLKNFLSGKIKRARAGSVFVGAGDSYAAALITSYMSSSRFPASDPYVLLTSPNFVKGRDVFFISVSGRTKSNVAAARSLRGIARRIAITSDASSPLADEADEVISLPYKPRPRTPGTRAFTLSLLAALRLAFGRFECNLQGALRSARKLSEQVLVSERSTTYFLGNQAAYGIAVYAAAKIYEILGRRSQAELLEEFSHLELFSLNHSDVVNILEAFDPARVGARLQNALRKREYQSSLLRGYGSNPFNQVFSSVFAIQLGILAHARAEGMSEPHLVHAKEKLDVSDSMIY